MNQAVVGMTVLKLTTGPYLIYFRVAEIIKKKWKASWSKGGNMVSRTHTVEILKACNGGVCVKIS